MLLREKNVIGFSDLKKWLRHRHPMIFIDRVIDYEPGKYIEALLAVSGSLDCIAGHFPERAIYPASHLIQAFSQCGIILFQVSTYPIEEDELTLVGSINSRFFKVIVPGDTVKLKLNLDKLYLNTAFFYGDATVEGKRVASIKLSVTKTKIASLSNSLW